MATISLNVKTNLGDLKQQFDKVSQSTKNSEVVFDSLAKELGQNNEQFSKLFKNAKNNVNAVKSWGTATDVAKKQQSEYRKVISKLSKDGQTYKTQINTLGNEYKKLAVATTKTGASTKKFGGNLKSIIGPAAAVTAGFLAVRAAWGKVSQFYSEARGFTEEIKNVTSITEGLSFEQIKKSVLSLSPALGTAKDLTAGLYQAISAGVAPAEALKFVGESAKFAKAGLTDTNTAVDVLTTALNSYGLEANQAGKISDIFFNVVKQGKTTGAELAANLGKAIPVFAAANIPIEQLGSGLATLTKVGLSTSEATTQLKAVVNSFLKPSSELSASLAKSGYESGVALLESEGLTGALKFLQKETGGQADKLSALLPNIMASGGALGLLSQNGEVMADVMASMQDATGATDVAFGKQVDAIDVMSGTWNKLQVLIGDVVQKIILNLAPSIIKTMEDIIASFQNIDFEDIAKKISAAITGTIKFAKGLIQVIPYLKPLLITLAGLKLLMIAFNVIASTNPVIIIIAAIVVAIAALVGAVKLIRDNWDKLKVYTKIAWEYIKQSIYKSIQFILKYFEFMLTPLRKIFDAFKKLTKIKIENPFNLITAGIKKLDGSVDESNKVISGYTDELKKLKSTTESVKKSQDEFNNAVASVKAPDLTLPTATAGGGGGDGEEAKAPLGDKNFLFKLDFDTAEAEQKYENMINNVSKFGTAARDSVDQSLGLISNLFNTVSDNLGGLAESLGGKYESLGQQIGEITSSIGNVVGGIVDGIGEHFSQNFEQKIEQETLAGEMKQEQLEKEKQAELSKIKGLDVIQEKNKKRKQKIDEKFYEQDKKRKAAVDAAEEKYSGNSAARKVALKEIETQFDMDKELRRTALKNLEVEFDEQKKTRVASIAEVESDFNLKKQEAEKETALRKHKLEKEAFETERGFKIASVLIAAAVAVATGFAQLGPIGGAVGAGLMATMAAIQIAAIASEPGPPAPTFATGTLEGGFRVPAGYENDNFNIGARTGETVSVQNELEQDTQPMRVTVLLDKKIIIDTVQKAIYQNELIIQAR